MQKKNALRHLLLRHLWLRRAFVDPDLYSEVTRTLIVGENPAGFLVSWTRGGARHERRYAPDACLLYARGDLSNSSGADGSDLSNEMLASSFADEALAPLRAVPLVWRARSLYPRSGLSVIGAILLGLGLACVGLRGAGAVVAALFLLEFAGPFGKTLVAAGFALLSSLSLPTTAVLGAGSYAFLQFFDPNSDLRALRVGLGMAVLAWAASRLAAPETFVNLRLALAFAPPCLAALYFRWTCGSHFRSLPLVLPLLAVGLAADGSPSAAVVAFLAAAASAVFSRYAHLFIPLRASGTAFRQTMTG